MSRRNRVFIGVLLIFTLGEIFLLYNVASGLDTRYRESAEETLADIANILASWVEVTSADAQLDTADFENTLERVYQRRFNAQIYAITKHQVNLRVLVTDTNGWVVYDSFNQDTGKDFRNWHDINLALAGKYGARTTRNNPDDPATTVMYISVPVYQENRIIGAVCVSKAVASHRELVISAQQKLMWVGLITLAGFLLMLILVSIWLTNPSSITHDVVQIFRQEKLSRPSRLLRRLGTVFKSAFLNMRDAMAGRNYSESYMQSLTHELKSPLTAIRGAAELLKEPMTDAQRARFTDNISAQVQRLQDLAERLLELSGLEQRRRLEKPQPLKFAALVEDVVQSLEARAGKKAIGLKVNLDPLAMVTGDAFLLQRAIFNLLENALDFSPISGEIEITLKRARHTWRLQIRDHGPGIPDYALDRLFEKFYSLRRPDSGQKSTGLGLPFVREIVQLHGGKIALMNHPEGGAVAIITLPV